MVTLAAMGEDKLMKFDEKFPDGRLCAEPSGKMYRLRDAIRLSEKLGRPLTEDEMEQFRIQ